MGKIKEDVFRDLILRVPGWLRLWDSLRLQLRLGVVLHTYNPSTLETEKQEDYY